MSKLNKASSVRRAIHPLGMRVVVKILKDEDITSSGLYLPEGSKEAKQQSFLAEVIEVASAFDEDTYEDENISGIPLGAMILIPRNAGISIAWDEQLRIVETKEVLAVVEELGIN